MNDKSDSPEPLDTDGNPTLPDRRAAIAHHMAALEELADPAARTDGWSPFARKLFLQVVAETGRVSTACQYAGLTKQSVYALRARDPLFAAGWDAACELSRTPLADSLYEQAVDGLTDTITREDGRTITRHRVDSRLSIAVLNRLDRRCDRAAEAGSRHLGAVGRWDEYVAAIGSDDAAAAEAILDAAQSPVPSEVEGAKVSQPSQLRPDSDEAEEDPDIPDPRIWWDMTRKEYRTSFPPPEGDECHEHGAVGSRDYHRSLSPEELDLVTRNRLAEATEQRAAGEQERESYFASLRAELAEEDKPQSAKKPKRVKSSPAP